MKINKYINENEKKFIETSNAIHEFAEIAKEEYKSSKLLADLLEDEGFQVERGIGSQDTAFRAVFGNGDIRIGFLTEYDALPNLAQGPYPYYEGIKGNGHGCGHNLLGVGSIAGAMALKERIVEEGLNASIIIYGCPSEEILYGKPQLIEDGYMKELDVALSWHPLDVNMCGEKSFQAMDSIEFNFYGKTAHASVCPEKGRSALDSAELMSVGVNYLREHVSSDVRIHYTYVNGGDKPNIVPEYAKVWYFIRAKDRKTADETTNRVIEIARGAAMMAGTTTDYNILSSGPETKVNFTLSNLAYQCMNEIEAPSFTDDDKSFAKEMSKVLGDSQVEGEIEESILKPCGKVINVHGSTDLSSVSHIVPTIEINTSCYVKGIPGHHWTVTAVSKTPIAHKGMLFAGKVLALMGYKILTEDGLLEKINQEFNVK